MKVKQFYAFMITIFFLVAFTHDAHGNAGPITVVEDTTFSVAPTEATDIIVEEEQLVFDFRRKGPYDVDVTVVYRMKNDSTQSTTQKMMFPLITDPGSSLMETVKVSVDGRDIDFDAMRLQDFLYDYTGNSHNDYLSWLGNLDMEHILKAWQKKTTEPVGFQYDDEVQVIHFDVLPREERFEVQIGYELELGRSHIMTQGFTFHAWEGNGRGSAGKWISEEESLGMAGEMTFFVWGSPLDLNKITMNESISVNMETKKVSELLHQWVMMAMADEPQLMQEAYETYLVKRIDDSLVPGPRHIELDTQILAPYFHHTYLGAVLYEVDFKPGDVREVKVEYTMRASQDRWETSRYGALVAYLLQPATGWKHFQNLTISVYPHPDQPYLLESSLSMEKDMELGAYQAYFDTLPEDNLVFRMYHRNQAETGFIRALSNPYMLLLVVPVGLVLAVLVVVSLVVVIALKKIKLI